MLARLASSLRFRLLLLVLLAVVPALALVLYTASGERSAAAAAAQDDALRVARAAADDQAALIEQARLVLVDLSQVYEASVGDVQTCRAIYSDLRARYLQGYPRYANLGVVNAEGRIFCSVVPVSGPVDLSDQADFQAARQSPEATLGEASFDEALGKTFVNLYYPVLDFSGQVRALLLATLDLDWLRSLADAAALPAGSTLTVFDARGRILVQTPGAAPGAQAAELGPELLRAVQAQAGAGTTELTAAGDVPRLYAFAPFSSSAAGGLFVAVGIPSEVVFQRADLLLARNLAALALVAVVAVAVSVFGSEMLVLRPVRALLGATQRLAAGDLAVRTGGLPARGRGEVGQLAEAFDQMAAALQQREAERQAAEGALRRSEELYRTLAHNFPDGAVILFDHDLRYILADGAGLKDVGLTREMLEGKTPAEIFSPEVCALLEPAYRAALGGEESAIEVPYGPYVYLVQSLPVHNERGEIFAGMAVTRDITERRQAIQLLERRVEVRTRELTALLDLSRSVVSTLELERVLEVVLDHLKSVVDYTGALILSLEGEMFHTRAYRGPAPKALVMHDRFAPDPALDGPVMAGRQPHIIPDVLGDTPEAELFRAHAGEKLKSLYPNIRTWLRVPLVAKDRLIGMLTLQHEQPNYYTGAQAALALAFANQAAVAIENARLFDAERRRADQFRLITEVGQHITSILALDELLTQTVRLIQSSFGYYHVHVGLIEGEVVSFRPLAGVWRGEPECRLCSALRLRVGREGVSGWVAASGEPLLVPDIRREPRYVRIAPDQAGSAMVLPLKVKGEVVGVLNVESEALNAFDETDTAVLQSLVSQLAVAIENARLYEQARQLAALEERQKLARDLHDSVSQALYGIALGARTARTLLDRDPARLADPLDYVLALAEAGLAEMRALIFELRPESLKTEGLVAALTKLADSLRARHRLEVRVQLGPEPGVPLETKEAFYRITQEALHNVAKHARASRVDLVLALADGRLRLEVRDDGIGFDPEAAFPGHLGLRSMRERAERLGARWVVESAPRQGTRLQVEIPLAT
jgi:PAS domain S-box-containing protein